MSFNCIHTHKQYSAKEAAELLGISLKTLRRETRDGQISLYQVRSRKRYSTDHLQEYLISRERLTSRSEREN